MSRYYLLFFIIISFSNFSYSQTIRGTIKDNENNSVLFCNVIVKNLESPNLISEFILARNGSFEITLKKNYKSIIIEVNQSDYLTESYLLENVKKENVYNVNFILEKNQTKQLEEIVITSEKKHLTIKKDTISYNVDKYKNDNDRKVQDVLKRLPGIEVNEKSGEIKFKGKPIETVTLDGDNLFGFNYSLGTKNINVDMIEQVQAIENYSENKLLNGIENNEKVALNLKLKKGIADYSGTLDLGVGKNDKFLSNNNLNLLGVSSKIKSYGILSFNNIGINNTSFDHFSGNKSLEAKNEKNTLAHTVISESIFNSTLNDDRVNINNLLFANYNIVFKATKKINLKSNVYFLKDKISFERNAIIKNNFDSVFVTSDNFNSQKKPSLIRGDVELKYNLSDKTLVEYMSKYSSENIKTNSLIQSNNQNNFDLNLTTENIFYNQRLIFTKKINASKAIQLHLTHAFNTIPQTLLLNNNVENVFQKSNFKKHFLEAKINLLANVNKLKYSLTFSGKIDSNPFESNNSNNQINLVNFTTRSVTNFSTFSFHSKSWSFNYAHSLKILNQKITDNEVLNNNEQNNILFEPTIGIKYNLNKNSFVALKTGINQNLIAEEFVFSNNVILNNRSNISNLPNLSIQKSFVNSLNYFYNDLYNQFSLSLGGSYHINKGGFFSLFNVNNNQSIVKNFYLSEKTDFINFNFGLKKLLNSISTFINITTSYSSSNSKNVVNSSLLRNNVNEIIFNEFSLRTAFDKKINFENNTKWNYSGNKSSLSEENVNKSIVNVFKVNYKYSQSFFTSLTTEYYLPDTNNNSKYIFVDLLLKYQKRGSKIEYNLQGKNLTNNKNFTQINTSDFSTSSLSNNLIKRYLFFNVTYSF